MRRGLQEEFLIRDTGQATPVGLIEQRPWEMVEMVFPETICHNKYTKRGCY